MKTLVYCLILFGLCAAMSAQEQASSTADPSAKFGPEARTAYLRWQKVKRDADVAYISSLGAALERVTRQGKLEEAVAIRAEIKRVSDQLNGNKDKTPLAEFLVGTSWVSSSNGVVVALKEKGKGMRQANGNEKLIGYQVISERAFTIQWPGAPATQAVLATDRQSFVAGEVVWKLKP